MSNTLALTDQYVLPTYGRFPISIVRGEGTLLWDSEGKQYLDFSTGIAVCSIGHCHPRMTATIQQQAATLLHCSNLYHIPQQAELAQYIVEKCIQLPGKIFFSNSGAESNDGLIKLARRFGHQHPAADGSARTEIITLKQSFHGRTLGGIAATGQESIKEGFSPILTGFHYATLNDLDSVKAKINEHTAAILLEPIQGEGGVHTASTEFLTELRALCDEHNILLMFDEVQCGFGRAGTLMGWCSIAPDIAPDAISWAKGLGGGFPIGCFWVSDKPTSNGSPLSAVLGKRSHGSTFGGNPMACAAAKATLAEIIEKDLSANAFELGAYLSAEILSWQSPHIEGVRGKGLLLGIALTPKTDLPEGMTTALEATIALMHAGLLVVPAGPNTVRLLPPLNLSKTEADQALAILKQVLTA